MKRPDDLLPEEQDPQYEELIALLRQANLNPMLVDPTERAQLLARARGRLFQTDPEVSTPEDIPVLEVSEFASFPSKPKALADKQHRGRRLIRLVNELVAVLVVIALIGSALLLFWHRLPSTGDHSRQVPTAPPIGPVGTPVTVHAQAGGLEMTMRITPGPYFLSEMLAADLSLGNHSQTTFLLLGVTDDPCHSPLKIVMTGGERPYDTNLQSNLAAITCMGFPGSVQLQPNQTISIRQYAALTSSGQVTLTARAVFVKTPVGRYGLTPIITVASPLDKHWPSLQISVSAKTPSDRLISLQKQGALTIVNAPSAARGQLLEMSAGDCSFGPRASSHKGSDYWGDHLSTMTIETPQCGVTDVDGTPIPGKLRWTYVVGAPGYTMVSGRYP